MLTSDGEAAIGLLHRCTDIKALEHLAIVVRGTSDLQQNKATRSELEGFGRDKGHILRDRHTALAVVKTRA